MVLASLSATGLMRYGRKVLNAMHISIYCVDTKIWEIKLQNKHSDQNLHYFLLYQHLFDTSPNLFIVKLNPLRPDYMLNLVHRLVFGTPKFYIAPYGKINRDLLILSYK